MISPFIIHTSQKRRNSRPINFQHKPNRPTNLSTPLYHISSLKENIISHVEHYRIAIRPPSLQSPPHKTPLINVRPTSRLRERKLPRSTQLIIIPNPFKHRRLSRHHILQQLSLS